MVFSNSSGSPASWGFTILVVSMPGLKWKRDSSAKGAQQIKKKKTIQKQSLVNLTLKLFKRHMGEDKIKSYKKKRRKTGKHLPSQGLTSLLRHGGSRKRPAWGSGSEFKKKLESRAHNLVVSPLPISVSSRLFRRESIGDISAISESYENVFNFIHMQMKTNFHMKGELQDLRWKRGHR